MEVHAHELEKVKDLIRSDKYRSSRKKAKRKHKAVFLTLSKETDKTKQTPN